MPETTRTATPKRANGEGSITRRTDGRPGWRGRITVIDASGEAHRFSASGRTRAETQAKLTVARSRVAAGQPVTDAPESLGAFVTQWLATTMRAGDRKPRTVETYASIAKSGILAQPIAAKPLAKLTARDIDKWTTELAATRAPSTVRQLLIVLRQALDTAVRDGLLARNPAQLAETPRLPRHEAESMSPEEVRASLTKIDAPRWRDPLALLGQTGMRKGEALGLRWSDVDEASGVIRVRGTLLRLDGAWTVQEPKTERSRRDLPITPPRAAILAAARARQDADRASAPAGVWDEGFYVFTSATGQPLDPAQLLRFWKRAVKAATGRDDGKVHTLRHSAASALLAAGVPLVDVSRHVGHSSVAITGDIYGHVSTDSARKTAAALSRLMG